MATIQIKEPREQEAHFGLYRTTAGGDETIFVRRKIAEPTDYMHTKSRKLKIQRDNLALASQHYSHLTPTYKAVLRHQAQEVEYQKSHGTTDTKLLTGRELFISKEMRTLFTTQKQLRVPLEFCFILTDELDNILDLEARLEILHYPRWRTCPGIYLSAGNTYFQTVPDDADVYKLGYATMGTFGYQLFTYKYPEFIKVHRKSVAPCISAHYSAPWIVPTHPPSFDWEPITTLGPPILWAYHVHQPTGQAWGQCFPWGAFKLTWRKITPDIFTVTIMLGYLVRNDQVTLRPPPGMPQIWQIIGDEVGDYHTDPPQHTCRFRIAPWQILSYEY